jgi:hypothetical protein
MVFSAFDIGVSLKCEVKSEEDDYKGVAILTIGPINCDEMLRSDIENIIEAQQSKYLVRLVNEIKDLVGKEKFFMIINKELIKIMGVNSVNSFLELQYSINCPEIEADYNDSLRISMIFRPENNDYEKIKAFLAIKETKEMEKLRLGILFENKGLKDVFLMVFRLFSAKKFLITNRLFEEFASLEKFSNIKTNSPKSLDFLLEIETLKRKNDQILLEKKELLINNNETSRISEKTISKSKETAINTQKIIEEKRVLEKKIYELESQIKDMQNPNKIFQEFDMKQSFLSDISVIEKFAKEDNVTARDCDYELEISNLKKLIMNLEDEKKQLSQRAINGDQTIEFKMMNEMLRMEVNIYKAQRDSQAKEIAHLKENLEKNASNKTNFGNNRDDIVKIKVFF